MVHQLFEDIFSKSGKCNYTDTKFFQRSSKIIMIHFVTFLFNKNVSRPTELPTIAENLCNCIT